MSISYKRYLCAVVLLSLLFVVPGNSYSKIVSVGFARTSSVTVVKANISDISEQTLSITGLLKRYHSSPMVGHLHAYGYSDNGRLIAESKHRVTGLNSKRRGHMRVPFKISIEEAQQETSRVFLEYHLPGHSES